MWTKRGKACLILLFSTNTNCESMAFRSFRSEEYSARGVRKVTTGITCYERRPCSDLCGTSHPPHVNKITLLGYLACGSLLASFIAPQASFCSFDLVFLSFRQACLVCPLVRMVRRTLNKYSGCAFTTPVRGRRECDNSFRPQRFSLHVLPRER